MNKNTNKLKKLLDTLRSLKKGKGIKYKKGKKTTSKSKGTYEKKNYVTKGNIFLDAFDTNKNMYRIPDGTITSSHAKTRELQGMTMCDDNGELFLLFLPGQRVPIYFNPPTTKPDATTDPPPPGQDYWPQWTQFKPRGDMDREGINKFRIVSTALRLTTGNEWDDQQGYWEAIRFPLSETVNQTLIDAYNYTPLINGDNQSYSKGLLSTLKYHQFELKPNGNTGRWFTQKSEEDVFDTTKDGILIHIVGKPGPGHAATTATAMVTDDDETEDQTRLQTTVEQAQALLKQLLDQNSGQPDTDTITNAKASLLAAQNALAADSNTPTEHGALAATAATTKISNTQLPMSLWKTGTQIVFHVISRQELDYNSWSVLKPYAKKAQLDMKWKTMSAHATKNIAAATQIKTMKQSHKTRKY